MSRAISIRPLAAGFAVAAVLLTLAVSFLIAQAFPASPPRAVTVAEAVAALKGQGSDWRMRETREPPFPAAREGQGLVIQAGLAQALDRPFDAVRVRLLTPERRGGNRLDGDAPSREAVGRLMPLLAGMATAPGAAFAPFEASVRTENGGWRTVTPPRTWATPERLRAAAAFLIAAFVLAPLAAWGAGRLSAPFLRLAHAADGDGRAEGRVGGPREARAAARALDAMRDRLATALRERTAVMAAIAHDLRTPLTGLRLRIEGLPPGARDPAVADIARMERLIVQLLTYVRGEEAAWTEEPLDLSDVAADCVAFHREAGRSVELRTEGEVLVRADRDQLERALGNLIDNAATYGGGWMRVGVTARDGQAAVVVEDDGPGLAPEQLEAVFSPFHRAETSRSRATGGAGLGLAIARSIVERTGGTASLSNRPEGGLRAEIRLPLIDAVGG